MTSVTSTATVQTERSDRYGKQLASHLGHRAKAQWDDATRHGDIVFGGGQASLDGTDDALMLSVQGEADGVGQLEDVVGRHLVRFGTRDELVVSWSRSDGTPGTVQRKTEDDPPPAAQ